MQRINSYAYCEKCDKTHLLTDYDCFPRFKIFTDDTGEDGYLIAARNKKEAAEFYVNGFDEDYELVNKDAVEVAVGDENGMDRELFKVVAEAHVSYTASPSILI